MSVMSISFSHISHFWSTGVLIGLPYFGGAGVLAAMIHPIGPMKIPDQKPVAQSSAQCDPIMAPTTPK